MAVNCNVDCVVYLTIQVVGHTLQLSGGHYSSGQCGFSINDINNKNSVVCSNNRIREVNCIF